MTDIFIPHEIRPFEAKDSSQAPLVQRVNSKYICFVDCPAFWCVQHDGEDMCCISGVWLKSLYASAIGSDSGHRTPPTYLRFTTAGRVDQNPKIGNGNRKSILMNSCSLHALSCAKTE